MACFSWLTAMTLRKPAPQEEVFKRVESCKIIPVYKVNDLAHAAPLAKALQESGIDVAEIVYRNNLAGQTIEAIAKNVPGCCVGAGTVMTAKQVDEAVQAGADFIVSPCFNLEVCKRCKQIGILYLPGVVTPYEALMASSYHGLKYLKFFPASNYGGAGTIKSLGAVFPGVQFMPTGGVTLENIHEFVGLPNVYAAGGTFIFKDQDVEDAAKSGDWTKIKTNAQKARSAALAGARK